MPVAEPVLKVRQTVDAHSGPMVTDEQAPRWWCTRVDPLADVWESEIVPLLVSDEKGALQGTGVLSWLQDKHPGTYDDGLLRTLQRRIRDWRALHGPPKEVFFEQEHVPGREAGDDRAFARLMRCSA